ncbi:c-type cytochrome [Noviherbaspirillum sp. UKPF54]|nr:c-type cytochrome [Noviherbaspirillum sp. UKPF54]
MTKTKHSLLAAARTLLPLSRNRIAFLFLGIAAFSSNAFAGAHVSSSDGKINPAAIYHNYCSVCHGDKGDGNSRARGSLNPPPRDFTSPTASQLTRDYMIAIVKGGKAGTAMVGWQSQMNQKEIEAVVDYVRANFMPANISNDMNRGRLVYAKNCSVCHGDKGDGRSRAQASLNPPPRDFTAPAAKTDLSKERMLKSVTYGRPETAMAGFQTQLSADDINAVVDYIRSSFMGMTSIEGISGTRHGKGSPAPGAHGMPGVGMAGAMAMSPQHTPAKSLSADMKAPLPHSLKGDAVKGAAFYMSNCATCHGTTGDGRGPRAYFIMPKPRNFLHPASRQELNRVALFNAISSGKLGTEMPAWDKVLTQQEIADVAEFVFQRFIQPPAGTGKQAKIK